MGEPRRSTSPGLRLDLDNFDSAAAERSRYVLTSPRSLQSCARLGIRPVQLLIKSLNELIAEQNELPGEAVRVMHESYQSERRRLLRMCQEERGRIIQAAAARWPDSNSQVPGKVKDYSEDRHAAGPVPLAEDIRKEMCVTVSERDRKIAALMLLKHREQQECLKLSQQEELERQEARRREEAQRAQAEKERRKKLRKSMQRWHEEEGNRREMLRHVLLKYYAEEQSEQEEARQRSALERKFRRSSEKRTKAVEERLRELQERAAQEEEHIQRARLRAELQRVQQLTSKVTLVQLSRRRAESAARCVSARHRDRAQQAREHNKHRQLCHRLLRERAQREEEEAREARESHILAKERRRERLRRQREQMQEEAHRLARASFHMRERVRQETHSRTFDQMAREAQLSQN
uniref:Coiled-coil domain containing 177 n=1 Tax=Mola mola TaxID=94237 RepID=A0A3Q4AIZ6_MOLML